MKRQHSERLGKESIPSLLTSLAMPATFGMFVMAFYNVVDAIFVARAVGTVGIAAVSIAFPVQMIVMAVAGAIGIGGASVISRMLGADNVGAANKVFGNIISMVLAVSVVGALLGLNLLTPILYLFGSSETILPYAQDYLGIILYGTIFFAFGFCMNNIVRSEGNARTAMNTMIISAVLNIILTPLFIFGFGMGIKGSALATVVAQGVTAIYLVVYFARGNSSLTFKLAHLRPEMSVIKQILAIGSSAFVQQAAGSIMFIFANHMLILHGGDLGVAVFGIMHRVIMFSLMPVIGIVQGLLPLVGYNYGANLHHRVSESISLAIKVSTAIVALGFTVIMAFPKPLMIIFTNDPAAIAMGQNALRIMFALSLTIGIQMVTGAVFQALGKARAAFILSMSRQVLFLIPLILILPFIFGLNGVWLAFPVADLLSFILALWFINKYRWLFFAADQVVISKPNVAD
ncbi:MAG: multidrug transporter MatE [Desulfotomaculum sp. BICA1-6]|nr:MAG: multidrug transporter MatE [Desulfotomaculum sp. BICA1-6]